MTKYYRCECGQVSKKPKCDCWTPGVMTEINKIECLRSELKLKLQKRLGWDVHDGDERFILAWTVIELMLELDDE